MKGVDHWFLAIAFFGVALGACRPCEGNAIAERSLPAPVVVSIQSGVWRLVGEFQTPTLETERAIPAVILLNKANGDRRAYAPLAALLARHGIASLRVDLRAHGESINRGRFVPFDSSVAGRALQSAVLDSSYLDVEAVRQWLRHRVGIDSGAIGIVGASYSAEAMAAAIRRYGAQEAYVALSPGNFSDSSLADVDRRGVPWLFVVSGREAFVRRQEFIPRLTAQAHSVRLLVLPDSAHATDLLSRSPFLDQEIADWLERTLRKRR